MGKQIKSSILIYCLTITISLSFKCRAQRYTKEQTNELVQGTWRNKNDPNKELIITKDSIFWLNSYQRGMVPVDSEHVVEGWKMDFKGTKIKITQNKNEHSSGKSKTKFYLKVGDTAIYEIDYLDRKRMELYYYNKRIIYNKAY